MKLMWGGHGWARQTVTAIYSLDLAQLCKLILQFINFYWSKRLVTQKDHELFINIIFIKVTKHFFMECL